jgi:DNA-binding response OmpR family regulator
MLVLIVEDEVLVGLALELAVREAGHQVLGPVDNVEGALTMVDHTVPSLALVDIDLRDGGNGTVLARALHERYQVPVLFLSAQVAQARSHRNVAWGLITKPYEISDVLRSVAFVDDVMADRPARVPSRLEFWRTVNQANGR